MVKNKFDRGVYIDYRYAPKRNPEGRICICRHRSVEGKSYYRVTSLDYDFGSIYKEGRKYYLSLACSSNYAIFDNIVKNSSQTPYKTMQEALDALLERYAPASLRLVGNPYCESVSVKIEKVNSLEPA